MRVVILTSSLVMGGAERVAVSLANYLSKRNVETYLMVFDNKESAYCIDDSVNYVKNINNVEKGKLKSFFQRIKYLFKTLNKIKPDIVFTLFYDITFYALFYKFFSNSKKLKIISSERNHPKSEKRRGLKGKLNVLASRLCDGFIFQTERAKKYYPKKVQDKSVVIHNGISNPLVNQIDSKNLRSKKIITSMGRLENQKAHDIMIRAFAKVIEEFPDYELVIHGEGSKREYLESLIRELNLEKNVKLPGKNENALIEVANGKIFLLTSRYEGMPNALMEAMAIGMPCISTDCEMGPAELISDGINGFLVQVDNIEELADKIIMLLKDPKLQDAISLESLKINETHSSDHIFSKYLYYFKKIKQGKISFKRRVFRALDRRGWIDWLSDEKYLKLMYYCIFNKKLNLENPQTFNEKLHWLKLNNRKDIYTTMVDKVDAKKYVSQIIGEEYIVPNIGVYDKFEDINFETLPNQFVIKCTHDSGGVVVCKNKEELDIEKVKTKINKHLKRNFFYEGREWPYKNIKPRILIEEYIDDNVNEDLNDYKFMCFNGKVKCSFVCTERRSNDGLKVTFFDLDWNKMSFDRHYPRSEKQIDKPINYDKMIKLSEKLSKDLPFARIDFYEVKGKIYFGEITFFPGNGIEEFEPEKYDYILGSWLILPEGGKNEKKDIK